LAAFIVTALPSTSPAPLIYREGEGWIYQPVGSESLEETLFARRAKDQLDIVQKAFKEQDYDLAEKAAERLVKKWPLSDFAPAAQYYAARCLEEKGRDEKAFKAYQTLLEKYPKIDNYQEILKRQYDIATRYLNGKKFRLFGVIPLYRSMEKTVKMYEKVIANGPYSEVAPQAQMNIGAANEKRDEFGGAVKAYESAATRYFDRKDVAADAMFKAAETYYDQAKTAEYDQGIAKKAFDHYQDFVSLHPDDPRIGQAREKMENLRTEQARGAVKIAGFYEKRKQWNGALVYYNEALVKAPNSIYAQTAKEKIAEIKARQKKEDQ
jgi:outer membrane assembly lipoprotein YfiO